MKLSQSTNAVLLLLLTPVSQAYAPSTLPTVEKYVYKTNPFKTQGLDVDLPDFHHLFKDIQKVSPLARAVITGEASSNGLKGLAAIDEENGTSREMIPIQLNPMPSTWFSLRTIDFMSRTPMEESGK